MMEKPVLSIVPINFCDEFDVPRQAYRDIAKQLDTLKRQLAEMEGERDALRKLVEDLKLGAECYLTAVSDLQAGYTPDTHPDWNAVQYLAGEAHAAILRANDVLGVDAGGDTAVPNEPDPPYPHRTRVCSGCGTAVDEDDLADGNLCHICIKR